MPMPRAEIEQLIREALPDAKIIVQALEDDGDHWQAYVESPSFAGMSKVKQHQAVYAALKGRMGGDLHALALTTSAG
jgi:stress-induced morphogen